MNKMALLLFISVLITQSPSSTVLANEELYPLIVKKNLFSPKRTEWRMEDSTEKTSSC